MLLSFAFTVLYTDVSFRRLPYGAMLRSDILAFLMISAALIRVFKSDAILTMRKIKKIDKT
jgi:hypothetical protein